MNSATQSLLIAAAGLALATGSNAAVYSQNFNVSNGPVALGDGSNLVTSSGAPSTIVNGALELTNVNNFSAQNTFNIPAVANSAQGFTMTFDLTLIDAAGGNPPADGIAIAYGNFGLGASFGEEGPGASSISWIIDTWDNGVGDRGIRSKINGVNNFVQLGQPLLDGQSVSTSVEISWNPVNGMSFTLPDLGGTIFTNLPTPGFTGDDTFVFGIGGRTGNATETVIIDNLVITTVPEVSTGVLSLFASLCLLNVRRRK